MGICVSHEPRRVELPNRAKNCSLLYRPIETSPYANIHRKSTLSGKSTHLTVPHSIDRLEHRDHLHIDKETKDMLNLDFIDEHVWKGSNPYCKLFQQDSQGKYVTEELINYELNSLKVQMAKSQAIIAALTSSPTTELNINYGMPKLWVPENAKYQNSFGESQNLPISPVENQVHIFPNEIISTHAPMRVSKAIENGLPSFLLPHSQTQSFDQNPEQEPARVNQNSRKNHSSSCPNLSLTLKTFSPNNACSVKFKNFQTNDEYDRVCVPDEDESNRKRSCSYLAAIQCGNTTPNALSIEEDFSAANIRKLSTLNEDDLEIVSTNAAKSSISQENKKNSPEPPPYRHPPTTGQSTHTDSMENVPKEIQVKGNDGHDNSDSPRKTEPEPMQSQSETRSKSAVCVSDIAFQRRAGFSFRRRPGQKGNAAAVVNALPTIRRSSAIELLDDTSPGEQPSLTFGKQKTSQHLHSSSHGHQQLSVEMETSETESAKGSIESEYDVPAVLGGFAAGQSPVPTEEQLRKTTDCDDFVEKLMRFNACHPGLLRLENLSDDEVENEFQNLCLVFNNSKITVKKRLETHQRQRDLAETNVTKELEQLKIMMKSAIAVSQNGNSQQKKQMATNLQQQLDVLQQVIQRLSGRAEIYGATEQEEKMCKAAEVMMQYVCNIKNKETKLQKELDETKRIMDRTAAMGLGNHAKAILSHRDSSASMTSPNLGRRRASLCLSSASSAMVSAQVLPLTCTCRQSMEEGDQLLKTKLRCPLHCGSLNNKRRSISVFTPPITSLLNEFKRISSNNSSTSSSNISTEKAAIEEQVKRSPLHTPIDDIKEKLWTTASSSNDQLQTLTINEIADEEREDSDSCMDDDFMAKPDDVPMDYNYSSDEGPDEYYFAGHCENSVPKSKENSWLELISLLKSVKTKKKSDFIRDILCWWKKSGDAIQLIRYVIGGFLLILAVVILVLSFIRAADHFDL